MIITFEEYLKIEALSSSAIKLLLKSAAHYKNGFSGISFQNDKMGTAAHALALENKKTIVEGIDCKRSSKADRLKWREFYQTIGADIDTTQSASTWNEECYKQTGIMIGTAEEANAIQAMAKSILAACPDLKAPELKKEVTSLFEYRGHKIKSRYDAVDESRHIVYDVKTCTDASPKGFAKASRNLRYDIQEHLYNRNYMAKYGVWPTFKFVAVEKSAPYYCAVYTFCDETGAIASDDIDRAIDVFEQCSETGVWPAYENQELSLYYKKEQGESVDDLDSLMA